MRIDAHHHLWKYNARDFPWIDESVAALRRDFLPQDFEPLLAQAHIDASVVIQARQSLEETRWLLECARKSQQIAGVVGWVPLTGGDALAATLQELKQDRRFVGAREILQDKPAGFLLESRLSEGIHHLTALDLTYDLLLRSSQLDEAIRLVDLHPNQKFVLDHAAKPLIAQQQVEPWAKAIRRLGQRPNVLCKLSGLATEADWRSWTEADLEPYLNTCLEAFGPQRCMAGSDWPVCLVATQYVRWWTVLERWARTLSATEQLQVMGQTAATFYRLPMFDLSRSSM